MADDDHNLEKYDDTLELYEFKKNPHVYKLRVFIHV